MNRIALILTFSLAWLLLPARSCPAQMAVSGALSASSSPPTSVMQGKTVGQDRRRRRERNPYFAARPIYPAPARPGARANITFEPFTRWYYPNEKSYYPPVATYPPIRAR